jgi:hypothetical protein
MAVRAVPKRGVAAACLVLTMLLTGAESLPIPSPSAPRGSAGPSGGILTATPAPTTIVATSALALPSPPVTPGGPAPTSAAPVVTPPPTIAATPVSPTQSTPVPTVPPASPAPPPPPPSVAGCPLFPASNVWNRRVDGLPVAANSATIIGTIGATAALHPDFGSYPGYGIPYNVVGAGVPPSSVTFDYASESDPGPYPIPETPLIEGGGDRHLLIWDTAACRLYELYAAQRTASGWHAGSGAIWDLRSNALRPDGWTSADAAGLPILPGLVRYDEVAAGAINHAIRFTAPQTRSAHIYPARHDAGAGSAASLPPMGLRVRLKAGFDMGGFSPRMRVILVAMQRYGMILADNGSPWFFTGTSDARWSDDELNQLKGLQGSDFEVVETSGFVNGG